MPKKQIFMSLIVVLFYLIHVEYLQAQVFMQMDFIESTSDGSNCFIDEIKESPEINLESHCFDPRQIPEICLNPVGGNNSMCYSFEEFQPSCAPSTILSVEFRMRATSSWECGIPLVLSIIDEDGSIVDESQDGDNTFITSFTENLQAVLGYEICMSYSNSARALEGCEFCIDGIERVTTYECGTTSSCCSPKGVKSNPFEPVFLTEGQATPSFKAEFISGGQSTFEELSINEVLLLGNSPLNFIEIKGNPNQVINDHELIIIDSNFGDSPGQVNRRIPIDDIEIPNCGFLQVKPDEGFPGEVFVKNNLRMGVNKNLSLLLIKKNPNAAATLDIDIDDDNVVDPDFAVVTGLDITQSTLFEESVYARSVGYEVYERPSSINRTLTYKSNCTWYPADPNQEDVMVTPGMPNAKVYWLLSQQGSNEVIKILPDYAAPNGTAFTELNDGKYCVKPFLLYETSELQADLSSISTINDITSIIEGGGICGGIGPCTPITVGPCSFDNFNIPDITICKDECATIDLNDVCEISSEYCVTWGDPVGFTEVHETSIEVCPIETTVYPLTITDDNGNFVASENVTVNVVCPEVNIEPEYPFVCNEPSELSIQTNLENPTFSWSNGSTSSTILVDKEGAYSVTVSDVNGCSESSSVNVYESQVPELSITADAENICANGGVAVLNATIGAGYVETYQWSNGESTADIVVSQSGSYGVTVTNFEGCTSESSYTIEDSSNEAPSAQITQSSTELCSGGKIMLSVEEDENNTYYWSNGSTASLITIFIADIYSVTVTNAEGCQAVSEVSIDANPAEALQVGIQYDEPATICNGESVMLNLVVMPASSSYDILWSNSSGSTSENLEVSEPGDYSVTVTSDAGCETVQSITIEESDLDFELSSDEETICTGGSTRLEFTITVGEADEIVWSTGEDEGESIIVSEPNTYQLNITDAYGCSVTKSIEITQSSDEGLNVELTAEPDKLCGDEDLEISVSITDDSGNIATYESIEWSEGTDYAESITISEAGKYSVTVTAENGCKSIAEIDIEDEDAFFEDNCFVAIPVGYEPPALKDEELSRSSRSSLDDIVIDIEGVSGSINVSEILSQAGLDDLRYSNDGESFKEIAEDYENGVEMAWAHVEEQDDGTQLLYIGSNASVGNDSNQAILNALFMYWQSSQPDYDILGVPMQLSCSVEQFTDSYVFPTVKEMMQTILFGCASAPHPGGFVPTCWWECTAWPPPPCGDELQSGGDLDVIPPFQPFGAGVLDGLYGSVEGIYNLVSGVNQISFDMLYYYGFCLKDGLIMDEVFEELSEDECLQERYEQLKSEMEGMLDHIKPWDEERRKLECIQSRKRILKTSEDLAKLGELLSDVEKLEEIRDIIVDTYTVDFGECGGAPGELGFKPKECNLQLYKSGKVFFELAGIILGGAGIFDDALCWLNKVLDNLTPPGRQIWEEILTPSGLQKIKNLRPDLKEAFRDAAQHLSPQTMKKLLDDPNNTMLEKWAKLNKIDACPLSRSSSCDVGSTVPSNCVALRAFLKDFFEDTVGKVGDIGLIKKLEGDLLGPNGGIKNQKLYDFFLGNPNGFRGWKGLVNRDEWVRNNTKLLEKLKDKDDLFISRVNDLYARNVLKLPPNLRPPNSPPGVYNGIQFDEFGFPKLETHISNSNHVVKIELDVANPNNDYLNAYEKLKDKIGEGNIQFTNTFGSSFKIKNADGTWSEPYTWHHHQDGQTMMPVLQTVHQSIQNFHTGGRSIGSRNLVGFFDPPQI